MNLMEALLKEMDRCKELLGVYKSIGPAGQFGALMIQNSLGKAQRCISEGNTVAMIAAYKSLKEYE